MNSRLQQTFARAFKVPAASIDEESGPHTIPAWDSTGHLNLVLELEKEFGVTFDEDEVIELIGVGAVTEALQRHGVSL